MRRIFNFQFSIFNSLPKETGFTLIELLIVIALITALSTAGIASFVSFNNSQTLNNAALDIVSLLQTAKNKSLSQVKSVSDTQCPTMNGYQVIIDASATPNTYRLELFCTNSAAFVQGQIKQLPPTIYFDALNTATGFLFQVISGTVVVSGGSYGNGTITLCRSGSNCSTTKKVITVKADGTISSQ